MALVLPHDMNDCDAVARRPENLRRAECMTWKASRAPATRPARMPSPVTLAGQPHSRRVIASPSLHVRNVAQSPRQVAFDRRPVLNELSHD